MIRLYKKTLAIMLIFTMIFSSGLSVYATGFSEEDEFSDPDEGKIIEVPENLDDTETPSDTDETNQKNEDEQSQLEDSNVENVADTDEQDDGEELPIEPETLAYKVKYFIDQEEDIELEIQLEVSADNPIVEKVSYENMPEFYILDEEMSTELPFTVTDVNNVIEVYYKSQIIVNALLPGLNSIATGYPSTTAPIPLAMNSTNDHTVVLFAWLNGSDVYFALSAKNPVHSVTYNGSTVAGSNFIETATNHTDDLVVIENGVDGTKTHNKGKLTEHTNKYNGNSKWSVIRIPNQVLLSNFKITVVVQGGGHSLTGVDTWVDSSLQVYHNYEGVEVFDAGQSGSLNEDLSYSASPSYIRDGQEYELVKVEITHNDIAQPDKWPGDLVNGAIKGQVVGAGTFQAKVKIKFIYRLVPKGKITISKQVEDYNENRDGQRKFDIFINGPDGEQWTVRLANGESKTIEGLLLGEYTVSEIVPMNYQLKEISNNGIAELSDVNIEANIIVTNKRSNDGWFHDEDDKENTFKVTQLVQNIFIIPESLEYKEPEGENS